MPLPAGGKAGSKNKSTLITFMNNIEPDYVSEYDSIHSYYGIIDDDNDSLYTSKDSLNPGEKYCGLKNLLVLKRYSKENYILDPINIYFYFRTLTERERKMENNNIDNLLINIEKKVKKDCPNVSDTLLGFFIKDIYEVLMSLIQKPTEKRNVTVKDIEMFLQIIVNEVKEKVFGILFKNDETFVGFNIITSILLKWILKISHLDLNIIIKESSQHDGFIKGNNDKKEISIRSLNDLKGFLNKLTTVKRQESKLRFDKRKFEELEKYVDNTELYTKLKELCIKETFVDILGIKLKYPQFFTYLRGHDLNDVLKRNEIFTGIINCDKKRKQKGNQEINEKFSTIIEKFEETGMGIFIPDEIIRMYKTFCHNITYNTNFINLMKKKETHLFILNMKKPDDCEQFMR